MGSKRDVLPAIIRGEVERAARGRAAQPVAAGYPVASVPAPATIPPVGNELDIHLTDPSPHAGHVVLLPGTVARGDLLYCDGATYVRLPIGAVGQVLTVQAGGGQPVPAWAAGGGEAYWELVTAGRIRPAGGRGIEAGYRVTEAGTTGRTVTGVLVPRAGDLTGVCLVDYQDALALAGERGSVTVTPAADGGTAASLFHDDSAYLWWGRGSSPGTVVVTVDLTADPIQHANCAWVAPALTLRSDATYEGSANPTQVRVEVWRAGDAAWTTIFDEAVSLGTGFATWVGPGYQWGTTAAAPALQQVRFTLMLPSPLPNEFRVQRVLLYHPNEAWDPWHLHRLGGTLYGQVAMTVEPSAPQHLVTLEYLQTHGGGGGSFWEDDANGDVMMTATRSEDAHWEDDANGDVMMRVA